MTPSLSPARRPAARPGAARLRIGTRGSPLALAQAAEVCRRLRAACPDLAPPEALEIVPIRTTGDREQTRVLAEIGGKGLFTKELEEALLAGAVDIAVHSMKDVETWLPSGLEIVCLLPREDPHDAYFSRIEGGLDALPAGAVVGTSSPRRRAQVLMRRPDLHVVPFRGNVETRLRKLDEGQADATLLAVAGLNRLDQAERVRVILPVETMLPAVGQGAIGIEARADDEATRALLAPIHCAGTEWRVAAERAMLEVLDGSCRTPIGGLATLAGDRLTLQGLVVLPDGSEAHRAVRDGPAPDIAAARAIGAAVGEALRARLGPAFGAAWRAG